MEVCCGMPFWRIIAATDVTAFGAAPQVEPPATLRETFDAAAAGRGNLRVDPVVAFHRERDLSNESATLFMQ